MLYLKHVVSENSDEQLLLVVRIEAPFAEPLDAPLMNKAVRNGPNTLRLDKALEWVGFGQEMARRYDVLCGVSVEAAEYLCRRALEAGWSVNLRVESAEAANEDLVHLSVWATFQNKEGVAYPVALRQVALERAIFPVDPEVWSVLHADWEDLCDELGLPPLEFDRELVGIRVDDLVPALA